MFILELYLNNVHALVLKMVRNKPRKTQAHWQTDPKQMEEAARLVLDGKGIRKVSEERGISKSTLQRYVAKTKLNGGTKRTAKTYMIFRDVDLGAYKVE